MGREAIAQVEVGDQADTVKLLLEAQALILRGAIRRTYPRDALEDVRSEAGVLRFRCAGEVVALHLGVAVADKWLAAIRTPLPSLRAKLGLATSRALWVGAPATDAALLAAIDGACTPVAADASLLIGMVAAPGDLAALLAAQPAQTGLPLWAVYPKGKGVPFGDAAIRAALRHAGYRDTKSCAVSERLTATRYHPPV